MEKFKLSQEFIDKLTQKCIEVYLSLPKSGKPLEEEWTVLSCVIKLEYSTDDIEIVSLGTGSKCIGSTKMSSKGDILNDSHAEVCARRSFLLYLYNQVQNTLSSKKSIFYLKDDKIHLNSDISFIFFSSQLPCGDASIVLKSNSVDCVGEVIQPLKRKSSQTGENYWKDCDIHRTGAKCLPQEEQDPKLPGANYHILGLVRTKPGRGDRTLSVSCSDKIAKWIHMGIQGSLLSLILHEPIYIKYFIFGAGIPFSIESLTRAFILRNKGENSLIELRPEFYQSTLQFPHLKQDLREKPAPGSIIWCKLDRIIHEVAVLGRKLGATKKDSKTLKNILAISKYNLYKVFINTININETFKQQVYKESEISIEKMPYNIMKEKSIFYKKRWNKVKENVFKTWTVKPNIWDFCLKAEEFD